MDATEFLTEKARLCYLGSGAGYVVPEIDPDTMRLFYNELQHLPSPEVNKVFERYAKNAGEMRYYPDSDASKLREAIAGVLGVKPENVYADASSDRVLDLIHKTFLEKKKVAYPDPSYGYYKIWSKFYDANTTFIPLREGFTLALADYQGQGFDVVVIANPNAPTGKAVTLAAIEEFVSRNPETLLIVDEAYIVYADEESAAQLTGKYGNLLVTQTFSKAYGLANLRLGYVIGNEAVLAGILGVKSSTNELPLSDLSIDLGAAAMGDQAYYKGVWEKVKATRQKFTDGLRKLGLEVVDSQANFVFAKCENGKELFDYLRENKVLTRRWDQPLIKDYLRISIGTEGQMDVVLDLVGKFMGN